jgi:hypothetical protein
MKVIHASSRDTEKARDRIYYTILVRVNVGGQEGASGFANMQSRLEEVTHEVPVEIVHDDVVVHAPDFRRLK